MFSIATRFATLQQAVIRSSTVTHFMLASQEELIQLILHAETLPRPRLQRSVASVAASLPPLPLHRDLV